MWLGLLTSGTGLAALLLFWVQPLVAKEYLPKLGGSPMVWNTAMLFFQVALLLGYALAHSLRQWSTRRQMLVQSGGLLLIALPMLILTAPFAEEPWEGAPAFWLLAHLGWSVGPAFVLLAASSPLLQTWLARSDHPQRSDPYFLYASGNTGSLCGLLAFPLLLEPAYAITTQKSIWMGLLLLYAIIPLLLFFLTARHQMAPTAPLNSAPASKGEPETLSRHAQWLVLSFAPSALLLGVTTFLTKTLATIPLLWVLPLAFYLLSFIVVFSTAGGRLATPLRRQAPLALLVLSLYLATGLIEPVSLNLALAMAAFFVVVTVIHARLVEMRPAPAQLTSFYLALSVGGALGGVFNALAAPLLFEDYHEIPLNLWFAGAALLLTWKGTEGRSGNPLPQTAFGLALGVAGWFLIHYFFDIAEEAGMAMRALALGLPLILLWLLHRHPTAFLTAFACVLAAQFSTPEQFGKELLRERTFFGVHKVFADAEHPDLRRLTHGSTVHGVQWTAPDGRVWPGSYYHPGSPLGDWFTHSPEPPQTVGLVGLGIGAALHYAREQTQWTLYEIDPAVIQIARDSGHFHFFAQCPAQLKVVAGDARLALAKETERFDLLILDAYSSASVPVHLTTREAVDLYLSRLRPGGSLLIHLSSLHINLPGIFARHAREAGIAAWYHPAVPPSAAERERGALASAWMFLSAHPGWHGRLSRFWIAADTLPEGPLWTDRQAPLLPAIQF